MRKASRTTPPNTATAVQLILFMLLLQFFHLDEIAVPGVIPHVAGVTIHTEHAVDPAILQDMDCVIAIEGVDRLSYGCPRQADIQPLLRARPRLLRRKST